MEFGRPSIVTRILRRSEVLAVSFSPYQQYLSSAGNDEDLNVTDLQTRRTVLKKDHHTGTIFDCSFSSRDVLLATASGDKTIGIWKDCNESREPVFLRGHSYGVSCVKFFQEPTKIISGYRSSGFCDGSIKIWSLERGKELTDHACEGSVFSVEIFPDDRTIVTGHDDGETMIWDLRRDLRKRRRLTRSRLNKNQYTVMSVRYNHNTFSLAIGGTDNKIIILDTRTYRVLQKYEELNSINSVCFHPSGRYLLSGSSDAYPVKVYDCVGRKLLYGRLLGHCSSVQSVEFSPDGNSFASGGLDKRVLLWKFPLGKQFLAYKDVEERTQYLMKYYLIRP